MSRNVVISIEEELLAEATNKAASEHLTIDQTVAGGIRRWKKPR